MDISTVADITDFFLAEHRCIATYQRSVNITHSYKDRVLWKGTVGVFKLDGHAEAEIAYAWVNDEMLGFFAPTVFFQTEGVNSPSAAITAHLRQSIQQMMSA